MSRLLLHIGGLGCGGAERVMAGIARHMAGICDVTLVTTRADAGERYDPGVVRRAVLDGDGPEGPWLRRNVERIVALRAICRRVRPDAALSFMCEPNARLLLATRGLGIKTVVSVRNDPSREYAGVIGGLVAKAFLPLADAVVFQTPTAAQWFSERVRRRGHVVPNPVGESFFEEGWLGGRDVVSVGRLVDQKNHALLVRASSLVADEHQDVNLRIYGAGPLEGDLRALACARGLADRVSFPGVVADVPAALRDAGVFVLPSDYEGLPNALMEAMAMGVPCLATDCPCGGPRSLIENGESGLLVPVGDEAAMAAALSRLLDDGALAARLGESARRRARASFAPSVVYRQWEELLLDGTA